MSGRLNYTHKDHLYLFIIYGESYKVIPKKCDTFVIFGKTETVIKKHGENYKKCTNAEKKSSS